MSAAIRILSGARAGATLPLAIPVVAIGRHPDSTIQFDPDLDLDVSTNHALLLQDGDRWILRDLESRNGTYVNGERVTGDTPLYHGDRISFGGDGAVAEFLAPDAVPVGSGMGAEPGGRAEAAVGRPGLGSRSVQIALAGLVVLLLGGSLYAVQRQRASFARERTLMQQRIDSIRTADARSIRSLEGQRTALVQERQALEQQQQALEQALQGARRDERGLEAQISRAQSRGDTAQVTVLREQLQNARSALSRQQVAGPIDSRTIQLRNRPAVALIYVELEDGEVNTGTAFAVRQDATLVTNRHVLTGNGGVKARRIAIQFSDSEQIWPARLVSVSRDADLAIIKVDDILGGVPTVHGLNARADTLHTGAPVALIGFPLSGTHAGEKGWVARPQLSVGVVNSVSSGQVEIQGYGAAGASGSPIFDANGEVVAILYGGRATASGQTIYGVPVAAALRLLEGGE